MPNWKPSKPQPCANLQTDSAGVGAVITVTALSRVLVQVPLNAARGPVLLWLQRKIYVRSFLLCRMPWGSVSQVTSKGIHASID